MTVVMIVLSGHDMEAAPVRSEQHDYRPAWRQCKLTFQCEGGKFLDVIHTI